MSVRRAGEPETPRSPAGENPAGDARSAEAEGARVEEDIDQLLGETRRERDEYLELAQRTKADFENYRRRVSGETEEAAQRAIASLAAELIPALDNLERALRAAGIDPAAEPELEGDEAGNPLARGVLLTYREIRAILERAGVESYDPAGEPFDPAWHEALQTRSADGVEAGKVLEVLERGYRVDGKVVRPARVVVSK